MTEVVEFTHFHLFAGIGGGARGFNLGRARHGGFEARFRCLGGVDSDPQAIEAFGRLAGVPGTVLDLFDRQQYRDFHGDEPTPDWREVTVGDLQRAAGGERPNIVFTSPPCKGFSGLLSSKRSSLEKYQALNRLTLRGVMLALEAWADDPPDLVLLENVPRIANRGRHLLDQITALLSHHGYSVAEGSHCCGEIGALAQTRKRFLLVARHREKVQPFLYQPPRRRLRAVGEVLGELPLPDDPAGGLMHRSPRLHWQTWVRLALIEAGGDWRSLQKLEVVGGMLRDYALLPTYGYAGTLGVCPWDQPSVTVTGRSGSTTGRFSVQDPRLEQSGEYSQLGVRKWSEPSGAVTGQSLVGGGRYAVADPRARGWKGRGKYRVTGFDESTGAVIAASATGNGAAAVADPRLSPILSRHHNKLKVCADPRAGWGTVEGPWAGSGHLGTAGAVTASARHDNGRHNVADPRLARLPRVKDRGVWLIEALDGTWHRPFTTLELAALQGLVEPPGKAELLSLPGSSHTRWRGWIGNAVPVHTPSMKIHRPTCCH